MTATEASPDTTFPPVVADAVWAAVEQTYSAIAGEKPSRQPNETHSACPCVAGIISFLGQSPWTLSWFLTKDAAPAIAQKFTGMDIPFDSGDMGDVVGELVNVLAGEVVAQLDRRKIPAQMSLPTVARGSPLELMPEKGYGVVQMDYTSSQGRFWLRLAIAGKGKCTFHRMPGT